MQPQFPPSAIVWARRLVEQLNQKDFANSDYRLIGLDIHVHHAHPALEHKLENVTLPHVLEKGEGTIDLDEDDTVPMSITVGRRGRGKSEMNIIVIAMHLFSYLHKYDLQMHIDMHALKIHLRDDTGEGPLILTTHDEQPRPFALQSQGSGASGGRAA